jgi:thioredoxin reductase
MAPRVPGLKVGDPYAIDGKFPAPDQSVDVLVIGGGLAGGEAAIEATRSGASVLLVDENPVSAGLMGHDVPLYFGGRYSGAVQNPGRMLEQVFAASPWLEAAAEAGAEIALSTTCWGAFVNGPGVGALPGPVAGLADETRSWMCGFERLVLATGARDLAMAFPGWDQPGVMGANALHALLIRYDAFAGRRVLILGSGDLALTTALMAAERGIEVVGIVEVLDAVQGSHDLASRVAAMGVPVLTGCATARAVGGPEGVTAAVLASVAGGPHRTVVCDTVCLAIGRVPAVELIDVLGGRLVADSARGGWVPELNGAALSRPPMVSVVGDAAGVADGDALAYRLAWHDALAAHADPSLIICQCEAVSRADLLGVQPPNYLPRPPKMAERNLDDLLAEGPANPDQIKRLTRAGMGVCQGRRCREEVAMILARASGADLADIPLASHRAPVRPLPLKVLAAWDEAAAMSEGWDIWFGIPSQWVPYRDIEAGV